MSRRWCTRLVSGGVSGGGLVWENSLRWVCLPHLRTSSGQERGAARGVVAGEGDDHAPAERAWVSESV